MVPSSLKHLQFWLWFWYRCSILLLFHRLRGIHILHHWAHTVLELLKISENIEMHYKHNIKKIRYNSCPDIRVNSHTWENYRTISQNNNFKWFVKRVPLHKLTRKVMYWSRINCSGNFVYSEVNILIIFQFFISCVWRLSNELEENTREINIWKEQFSDPHWAR